MGIDKGLLTARATWDQRISGISFVRSQLIQLRTVLVKRPLPDHHGGQFSYFVQFFPRSARPVSRQALKFGDFCAPGQQHPKQQQELRGLGVEHNQDYLVNLQNDLARFWLITVKANYVLSGQDRYLLS